MKRVRFLLLLWSLHWAAAQVSAQNVAGYGMIPEPFLFLLREPAVHADLGLSAEQTRKLVGINESFDGVLLATRNIEPEESQKRVADVMEKTRDQVASLLSSQQQNRLRQIAYRLRGLSFVLLPEVSQQLGLSDQQKHDVEAIVNAARDSISKVQTQTYEGEEAHQNAQRVFASAREKEHESILAILDDKQKQRLLALVGRPFDATALGKVTFKAPDFSDGDEWINSAPLKLDDLRGKVVAMHFWAYG